MDGVVIALDHRPRLVAQARLRFDRRSGGYLLLYPERGLALNASAAAIVALCDGSCTVAAIADLLANRFGVPADGILDSIQELLGALIDRGLLVE